MLSPLRYQAAYDTAARGQKPETLAQARPFRVPSANAARTRRPGDRMRYSIDTIGQVRSRLKSCAEAPRQGDEGAPEATLELHEAVLEGLSGVGVGDELIVLTWFHEARRDVLGVHPRGDTSRSLAGVFSTRSPDRPNPIGLHRVRVLRLSGASLDVEPLEAIDGTPIIDIKPVLLSVDDR
jgi:tRNA-Thr(GGU) m(6)t(6)A37 methyltransferase TsaA